MTSLREEAWEEAVRSFGGEPEERIRPNVLLWLKYAYWGPLPERYRWWVLYDTTTSTWILRYFVRLIVAVSIPTALLVILLPAPAGLRALTASVTAGCSLLLAGVWVNESSDQRLVQAGWPAGLGPQLRRLRGEMHQRLANARRHDH